MFGAFLASATLASALAGVAAGVPEKWFFWNQHLETDRQMSDFSNAVARASAAGYDKILLSCGQDYWSFWPDARKRKLAAAVRLLRERGLGICSGGWSIGYGAMTNYGCEYIEGAPVDGLRFVAGDGKATYVPDASAAALIPNGGFERHEKYGFPQFTFIDGCVRDGWTFQDREVRHSGEASLRMELSPAVCKGLRRISHRINARPHRQYRFSAWVKWEGFDPKLAGLRLLVQRDRGKGKIGILDVAAPRAAASDWVKVETMFNSMDYGELRLWVGTWESRQTGRYWVDDMKVEEVAPNQVLHAFGTPITVMRARDGNLYTEGRDFTLPAISARTLPASAPGIELVLPPGSRIRKGEELLVSVYTPLNSGSGNDRQVSLCPSNPALYHMLRASAERIQEAIRPDEWLLAFDEWRCGNTCAACRARNTTLPAMIADCAAKCTDFIREISPKARVWVWSDMFCPWENAHPDYYAVRGSCEGGLPYLRKDIGVGCWGRAACAMDSMSMFERAGHATFAGAFYDEGEDLADSVLWLKALRANPHCAAIMYTTWRGDYRLLEKFAALVDTTCGKRTKGN